MNLVDIENVSKAILYEGYSLYPYRPTSIKNRERWALAAVYPESFCQYPRGSDSSRVQTECLIEGDASTTISVVVHYLEYTLRRTSGDRHHQEEAIEREIAIPKRAVRDLADDTHQVAFAFSDPEFSAAANVTGMVTIIATRLSPKIHRVTVLIENLTDFECNALTTHQDALPHSLVSCHILMHLEDGAFVSAIDPDEALLGPSRDCENLGLWPVLVGTPGTRTSVLAAPIILYDYPQVAPESPGDLFDATEIDEILTLRILTLTNDEKTEMSCSNSRTRALLERTERLDHQQLLDLHASMKSPKLAPGDRVVLRPRGRSDAFDLILSGMSATVATIEQDFEGQIYTTVLIDDDPGKDLGELAKPGHRFFFRASEVEKIDIAIEGPT